jgi:hypothetical protein
MHFQTTGPSRYALALSCSRMAEQPTAIRPRRLSVSTSQNESIPAILTVTQVTTSVRRPRAAIDALLLGPATALVSTEPEPAAKLVCALLAARRRKGHTLGMGACISLTSHSPQVPPAIPGEFLHQRPIQCRQQPSIQVIGLEPARFHLKVSTLLCGSAHRNVYPQETAHPLDRTLL